METLRNYLNSLDRKSQQSYAERCGTTIGYLRKAISKGSKFDGALAKALAKESKGAVKKSDLRPDIWTARQSRAETAESMAM